MYPRLAICMPYHENPHMLAAHYANWACFPRMARERMQIRICDDASPKNPAWIQTPSPIDTRVFRIRPPHIRWSHKCATNIAAHNTTADWLLLTDMDHVVPLSTCEHILTCALNIQNVYTFKRRNMKLEEIKHHPDTWLIHRDTWKRLGGWDERFRGYYGQNADCWRRVRHIVGEPVELPVYVIGVGRDDVKDASAPTSWREGKIEDKREIEKLRKEFRRAGTFFESHQLTAKYDEVTP